MQTEIIIERQVKWIACRFGLTLSRARLLARIVFETRGSHG
jgi:hypothetical protein